MVDSVARLTCVFLLLLSLIFLSPAYTQAYELKCAGVVVTDPCAEEPTSEEMNFVPPENLNSCFSQVFTIATDWDWESQNAIWNLTEIQQFANWIVPPKNPIDQICYEEGSIAELVTKYIGEDQITSYPGVRLSWLSQSELCPVDRTNFLICLYEDWPMSSAVQTAGFIRLSLHGDTSVTPEELARYAFAHEWGHLCDYSRQPWIGDISGDGCANWTEISGLNGAEEFPPHTAEFLAGVHEKGPGKDDKWYRDGFGMNS